METNLEEKRGSGSKDQVVNQDASDLTLPEPVSSQIVTSQLRLAAIVFGLLLAIFVASIDETIVSTALGSITRELNAPDQVTWIAVGYLLTMTAFTPLYGKFSDIFGRKPSMAFAFIIFLLGSIFSGVANNAVIVIIFRSISGIGAGGLVALPYIIVSEIVPIEKRSLLLSLNQITFSVAGVLGPLLGGIFVDYLNWRWVFFINIPIILVAMPAALFLLPPSKPSGSIRSKLNRIDYLGACTLVVGIILLVLALNWGGKEFTWNSAPVITCLCLGIVILIVFLFVEARYAKEPIIPVNIFNRNVILCSLHAICLGSISLVFFYHWPLFYQRAHNATGTQAGIELLPIIIGECLSALSSGFLVDRLGFYRYIMILGMIFLITGNSLMVRLPDMNRIEQVFYPLLIGIGMGFNIQTTIVASQAAVAESDVSIMTAFITFCFNIGGVIGLAIHGAILDNSISHLTQSALSNPDLIINSAQDSSIIISSYQLMFLSLIPVGALSLLCILLLRHIPIVNSSPAASH